MSVVPVYVLFAFMDGDDDTMDERRMVAEWQVESVVRWCMQRGYDNVYLSRDKVETARFARGERPKGIKHHGFDDGGPAAA